MHVDMLLFAERGREGRVIRAFRERQLCNQMYSRQEEEEVSKVVNVIRSSSYARSSVRELTVLASSSLAVSALYVYQSPLKSTHTRSSRKATHLRLNPEGVSRNAFRDATPTSSEIPMEGGRRRAYPGQLPAASSSDRISRRRAPFSRTREGRSPNGLSRREAPLRSREPKPSGRFSIRSGSPCRVYVCIRGIKSPEILVH